LNVVNRIESVSSRVPSSPIQPLHTTTTLHNGYHQVLTFVSTFLLFHFQQISPEKMQESPYFPQLSLTQSQLNASIHHAASTVTQRAVRDFGAKMVADSKHELILHFTTEALDEVADIIIRKASDSFLDKCLEKRLLTIEAKPLINALAKAERLGYEPGDVIQEDQHERVIPHEAYPGASAGPNGFHARPSQPPPAAPPPAGRTQLQCMKCFRTFTHAAACEYVGWDQTARDGYGANCV
jgi:hypothetical protein